MTSPETMRRFAPWLLGLFMIAQVAGVVPLFFDHAVHVYESQQAISGSHDHSLPGRHGDHRHGVADVKDECCSLAHLAGVLPFKPDAVPIGFADMAMVAPRANPLTDTSPLRLDRPPKPLSLI
jgi:hypothetical protein